MRVILSPRSAKTLSCMKLMSMKLLALEFSVGPGCSDRRGMINRTFRIGRGSWMRRNRKWIMSRRNDMRLWFCGMRQNEWRIKIRNGIGQVLCLIVIPSLHLCSGRGEHFEKTSTSLYYCSYSYVPKSFSNSMRLLLVQIVWQCSTLCLQLWPPVST